MLQVYDEFIPVRSSVKNCYDSFDDDEFQRKYFPFLNFISSNEGPISITDNTKINLNITRKIPLKEISGYLESAQMNDFPELKVKFTFRPDKFQPTKWTQIHIRIDVLNKNIHSPLTIMRVIGLSIAGVSIFKLFENSFSNIPQAYASTSTVPVVTSTASAISSMGTPVTASSVAITTILSTKIILASVVTTMLITSGLYLMEPDLFEINPSVENSTNLNLISTHNVFPDEDANYTKIEGGDISTNVDEQTELPESVTAELPESVTAELPESVTAELPESVTAELPESVTAELPESYIQNIFETFDYSTVSATFSTKISDHKIGKPAGVALGSIIVVDRTIDKIKKFDTDGNYLFTFGEDGRVPGPTLGDAATQIITDSEKNVLVADTSNNRIQIFDKMGNYITSFGQFGNNNGEFWLPRYIAVDSDDNIIVADTKNRIQIFDKDGNYIRSFGNGYLETPTGIAVDSDDNIIVADTKNRIQIFDKDGNYIRSFGESGSGDGELNSPQGIAINPNNNNIIVADNYNHRIQIFDKMGNYITSFGEKGNGKEQFQHPINIAVDSNNDIYVADFGNDRIQRISFDVSDSIITFSEKFDTISCNANSMINNPISVPVEIATALPLSELLSRANSLSETGQFQESLFMYYIASQIEPENVHVWNGIGYAQTFLCENNSPIDAYSNSLQLDDSNINALNGVGFFYTNQAQRQSQNHAPDDFIESLTNLAITNYESSLQLDANNINALNGLGTVQIILEQYTKAINLFEKSLAINPDRITSLNGIAFCSTQVRKSNTI